MTPQAPEPQCIQGPVNVAGTLDGIGYEFTDNTNMVVGKIALSIAVTSSSEPVLSPLNVELEPGQWSQVARGSVPPATVQAAGVYHRSCQSFYNDGKPCLDKGACVLVKYLR